MKKGRYIALFICLLHYGTQAQELIAHYPLDNSANDISGFNNNGTAFGGVSATADRFGNPCGAMLFNGSNGYIEVPSSASLNSPSKTFSVTGWFRLDYPPSGGDLKWVTMVCKGQGTGESSSNPHYRVQSFQSSSQSTISINTDFTEYDMNFSAHPLQYGRWSFYALIYDGRKVTAYIDGQKIWEFAYALPLNPNSYPLYIGRDDPGAIEYFCGALDDIRIFSSALSEKELDKVYKDNLGVAMQDFTFTCPSGVVGETEENQCGATMIYDQPELIMNCGKATYVQTAGLKSGEKFPLGITRVAFEATSSPTNKKKCSFTITVLDKIPPKIQCPKDTSISIHSGSGFKFVYSLPPASDNCSIEEIKLAEGLSSGSMFSVGTHTLKFMAIDKSGNSAECSYSVHIVKTTKPAVDTTVKPFTCPSDIVRSNDTKRCGAQVHFTLNQPEEGHALQLSSGLKSGSFFPVGTTANIYKFAGHEVCKFNITVKDDEKPEIKCPNDTVVYLERGKESAMVNYHAPATVDNCAIKSTELLAGLPDGSAFPKGKTENIFKTTDAAGNSSICSFTIFLVDTFRTIEKKPVIDTVIALKPKIRDSINIDHFLGLKTEMVMLEIFDNATQDNDSVSIYFNGELLVDREMIRTKANGIIRRTVQMKPGMNLLVVKAWNVGTISPNTLRIDFYPIDPATDKPSKKPLDHRIFKSQPGTATAINLQFTP